MSRGDSLLRGSRPTPHVDFRHIWPRDQCRSWGLWAKPESLQQEAQVPRSKMSSQNASCQHSYLIPSWLRTDGKECSQGDPSLAFRQRSASGKSTMMFLVPILLFFSLESSPLHAHSFSARGLVLCLKWWMFWESPFPSLGLYLHCILGEPNKRLERIPFIYFSGNQQ